MDDSSTDVDGFLRQVGGRLQAARKRAGISLQTAADHLGLSRAAVGHWESGKNPIDLSKLRRLARLYGTTVVAVLADEFSNEDLVAITTQRLMGSTALPKTLPEKRHRAAA